MPSVLFVCQGNLYRSVAASAIFADKLRRSEADWQAWRVESAGTWARENLPATPEMMAALAKRGLDVKNHLSRMVSAELLAGFAFDSDHGNRGKRKPCKSNSLLSPNGFTC